MDSKIKRLPDINIAAKINIINLHFYRSLSMSQPLKIGCCIYLVLIMSGTLPVWGQNIHYSNIREKLFVHNPSAITNTENISFQTTFRNQWPGSSTYNTIDGAFLIHSEPLKSTAGILIIRDVQGNSIINHTSFGLVYAYKLQLADQWHLSAGITGTYNIYQTNFGRLTFENGQTPLIPLNEDLKYFDFSTGLELAYSDQAKYGFSVSRLASITYDLDYVPSVQINISYLGNYILGTVYDNSALKLQPAILASIQRSSSELLYGARIAISSFEAGIYVRQNLRFEFDALIILLGIRYGNISFYYSYDINLPASSSRFTNLAAHEVTFLYDMQYKRKRSNRKAIKCPKF